MKRSFIVLVIVAYFVNVCVSSFYVLTNPSNFHEDTLLGFNGEAVHIVQKYDQGLREKRGVQEALRKRRVAKYSDKIYFPGETNAKPTTKRPIVPNTVLLRNKMLITRMCPKGSKLVGGWCVPTDGDDYDYY